MDINIKKENSASQSCSPPVSQLVESQVHTITTDKYVDNSEDTEMRSIERPEGRNLQITPLDRTNFPWGEGDRGKE